MKNLKKIFFSLFALILIAVPTTLVGCDKKPKDPVEPETPPVETVEVVDGAYYCSYVSGTHTYQAIQLNRAEEKVYLYVCPADTVDSIDALMGLVEDGTLSAYSIFEDYTTSVVDGSETITITAQLEYYTVVYTAVAVEGGQKIQLNEFQTYTDGGTAEYDHVFTIYVASEEPPIETVEFVDGAYYCSYVSGTQTYQAIKLDRTEEKVYLYVCPADTIDSIDELMGLIDAGTLSANTVFDEYTSNVVAGHETIILSVQSEYCTIVYTAVAADEGQKIQLREIQTYEDDPAVEYNHEFVLYNR